MYKKIFILKWFIVFLMQVIHLNVAIGQQQFLSPDEFLKQLKNDEQFQGFQERTTLPTHLYKPVAAPTEQSQQYSYDQEYNNNNQPHVFEQESSARVKSQLPDGTETDAAGNRVKERVSTQDLSDDKYLRTAETHESEKNGDNGENNWSKTKTRKYTFKQTPRETSSGVTLNQPNDDFFSNIQLPASIMEQLKTFHSGDELIIADNDHFGEFNRKASELLESAFSSNDNNNDDTSGSHFDRVKELLKQW